MLPDQPIALLVAALRSGEYKQCRRRLSSVGLDETGSVNGWTYCCLGVACDIAPKFQWQITATRQEGSPPIFVQRLYGLNDISVNWMMVLNDTDYQTFDQIADAIVSRTTMGVNGRWRIASNPIPAKLRVA